MTIILVIVKIKVKSNYKKLIFLRPFHNPMSIFTIIKIMITMK